MTRRVIVTGGLGALGAEVARAFEAAGHRVAVLGHGPAPAEQGRRLVLGGVELTDAQSAAAAAARVAEAFGGLDVLVNAAGAFAMDTLQDGGPEAWRRMFEVNLVTCATMCRAALPHFSAGGAIVNVGSASAAQAAAAMGPYAASKSAIARLTESLAAELKPRGIRVNAVLPAVIDTPQNRAAMPKAEPANWTSPAAIAEAIVFLAGDAARAINGALVPVTNAG
jgi:NAD(P)-dependent dehydrogenase (short-subunit alcohol dehydrogenase family)